MKANDVHNSVVVDIKRKVPQPTPDIIKKLIAASTNRLKDEAERVTEIILYWKTLFNPRCEYCNYKMVSCDVVFLVKPPPSSRILGVTSRYNGDLAWCPKCCSIHEYRYTTHDGYWNPIDPR